jgi:hypothetical protein
VLPATGIRSTDYPSELSIHFPKIDTLALLVFNLKESGPLRPGRGNGHNVSIRTLNLVAELSDLSCD